MCLTPAEHIERAILGLLYWEIGVMGGVLFKGLGQDEYIKLYSPQEEEDPKERLLRRRPARRTKFDRPKAPKFLLYDMEESRVVDDHESVRKLLLRIPEWVLQRPTDGYIEYWYYFARDGQPLTPSRLLYPAARARLPWPCLYSASPEMLQNFAYVVNRIAHRQLVSMLSTVNKTPYKRLEKRNFSTKGLARTQRLNKLDQSMKRCRSWRPMSLVKYAYHRLQKAC